MSIDFHQTRKVFDLSQIEPEPAKALHDYWMSMADGPGLPRRKHLDLTSLRPVMGNLALLEVTRMPFRVRYRIVGTELVRLLGFNPTGKPVDELYDPQIVDEVHETIQKATLYRKPRFDVKEFRIFNTSLGYRRLVLPLEKEADGKQYIILCIHPIQSWLQTAADWKSLLTKPARTISTDFSQWTKWSSKEEKAAPDAEQILV